MSEQNSSGFPFAEVPDSAGLDIDAIFGGAPNGGVTLYISKSKLSICSTKIGGRPPPIRLGCGMVQ